jgi:prolyl oligopeptidase
MDNRLTISSPEAIVLEDMPERTYFFATTWEMEGGMTVRTLHFFAIAIILLLGDSVRGQEKADPYLWLESIDGEKSFAWVHEHNDSTLAVLKQDPRFQKLYDRNLEVYNSADRIAYPEMHGSFVYNIWQDAKNERGIWRRTPLDSYLKPNPEWELVLDLDSLSKAEGEIWVFKWAAFLSPGDALCMLCLSRGGGDAVVAREFDLRTRRFVKGGFSLPEAKSGVSWQDENTLIVGTDFGKGTMTNAGYPRVSKIWKRGTELSTAVTLFEGESTDNGVSGSAVNTPERQYVFVDRYLTFFSSNVFAVEKGVLVPVHIPHDAAYEILGNQLIIWLKSDWKAGGTTYRQGSLLSEDYDAFLRGRRNLKTIFTPTERSSVHEVRVTRHLLLVSVINNIRGELYEYAYRDGTWGRNNVAAPEHGTISIVDANRESEHYFFTFTSFLTPQSLYHVTDRHPVPGKIASRKEYFDAAPFAVTQHEAKSKDGTMIPYFLVARKDLVRDGKNPVVLEGYGGFEIAMLPYYNATNGYSWLENGGTYVLANIRGGGEFGPRWHLSAMKKNRHKVHDDFIAVAEHLIHSGVTSPAHLGIVGGSNGGLLVGAAFTQRPELFGGVVCQVPLLDMKRYSKLLAGASWMAEYGDPDKPAEWAYIKKYSPYQNVHPGTKYPMVFFMTSTRDDRVHPGHARKMAARMEGQGHRIMYYENTEGGHGGSATNKQAAFMNALEFVYFLQRLR